MPNTRAAAIVVAAFALLVVLLSFNLPHQTFFNGDPGVKLIAARQAWAHPTHPLHIDLPVVGGQPVPFIEPFFPVHGDHAHAITSELFALLSAPFVAAWGFAGAHILPGLGFLATLIGCAWLAAALDGRRSPAVVAAVAAVCTPLLFYGLEFWEHAPAAGAASLGAALLVSAREYLSKAAAAGVLLGIAVMLRPEALWFALAIVAALPLLPERPRVPVLIAAGVAAAVTHLPITIYALAHFGAITTPHISDNARVLSHDWLVSRPAFAADWLVPAFLRGMSRPTDLWSVAPAIALALVPLPARVARRGRAFLAVVTLVYVVLVVATAPNDGGAQWGPRYLLLAYIPLAILTADVLSWLAHKRGLAAVAIAALLWCLWVDRAAYRELRSGKLGYAPMVAFVEQHTSAGEPLVSDLIWLDQICVRLSDTRTFLYATHPDERRALLAALDRARTPGVVLVATGDELPAAEAWFTGTCYTPDARASIAERGLTTLHARRHCP